MIEARTLNAAMEIRGSGMCGFMQEAPGIKIAAYLLRVDC